MIEQHLVDLEGMTPETQRLVEAVMCAVLRVKSRDGKSIRHPLSNDFFTVRQIAEDLISNGFKPTTGVSA